MHPQIPARLAPLFEPPVLVADLTWDELQALVTVLTEVDLGEDEREALLRFLDANLPGGRLRDLLDWPGDWFGNRWLEEIVLGPEELAYYALARSGRDLRGAPDDPELPFPIPEA